MEMRAGSVVRLPLWRVLTHDPAYLRYEIERMARDFGYDQMLQEKATSYGAFEVTIHIDLHQRFTEGGASQL